MGDIRFQIPRNSNGTDLITEYVLPYQPRKTIYWWLTRIQESLDASLAFPVSCRDGLCGGCGLRINGQSVLSCETMLDGYLPAGEGAVALEPLQGFPVVRDLLIDWILAGERMKKLFPWNPEERGVVIQTEIGLKRECHQSLMKLGSCITCGLCVSECPAMLGGSFLEPYVFIKCQKILVDPRIDEETGKAVVSNLAPYFPQCLHCGKCTAVCPRRLSPESAILYLQELQD